MLQTGDEIGPYTLLSKLGSGSFGVVWLAEKRTVLTTIRTALKIPLTDDLDLDSIRREAEVWVQASGHPNVLPIIEANVYGEYAVIASEYAPDGSLETWMNLNGGRAPSIRAAIDMSAGILAGLEHLHAQSIIHRDLKPANILLQRGAPRLADFGVSRVLKSTNHKSFVSGTPAYMAPETFDGHRSQQTDVWSVGVILYQLLSGSLPFPQTDMTSLLGGIITREPEPLPVSVPAQLQRVVERALRKKPSERYGSAEEMRRALLNASHALNAGETIRDREEAGTQISNLPTIIGTARKRRSSAGMVALVVAVVVIVALLAGVAFLWGRLGAAQLANRNIGAGPSPTATMPSPSPSPTPSPSPSPTSSPSPSPKNEGNRNSQKQEQKREENKKVVKGPTNMKRFLKKIMH